MADQGLQSLILSRDHPWYIEREGGMGLQIPWEFSILSPIWLSITSAVFSNICEDN